MLVIDGVFAGSIVACYGTHDPYGVHPDDAWEWTIVYQGADGREDLSWRGTEGRPWIRWSTVEIVCPD